MDKREDNASNQPSWAMPKATTKTDGSARQVGVEFELQGIPVDSLAELTASTLGGDIGMVSEAEYEIRVPGQGDYRVDVKPESTLARWLGATNTKVNSLHHQAVKDTGKNLRVTTATEHQRIKVIQKIFRRLGQVSSGG